MKYFTLIMVLIGVYSFADEYQYDRSVVIDLLEDSVNCICNDINNDINSDGKDWHYYSYLIGRKEGMNYAIYLLTFEKDQWFLTRNWGVSLLR